MQVWSEVIEKKGVETAERGGERGSETNY
jgi:hypothetical protein